MLIDPRIVVFSRSHKEGTAAPGTYLYSTYLNSLWWLASTPPVFVKQQQRSTTMTNKFASASHLPTVSQLPSIVLLSVTVLATALVLCRIPLFVDALVSPTRMSTSTAASGSGSNVGDDNNNKNMMEATVRKYFEGVNRKDPTMIRDCFGDKATIRDVCGINSHQKTVPASTLVERCMEFVTAHPDTLVRFHYVRVTYLQRMRNA